MSTAALVWTIFWVIVGVSIAVALIVFLVYTWNEAMKNDKKKPDEVPKECGGRTKLWVKKMGEVCGIMWGKTEEYSAIAFDKTKVCCGNTKKVIDEKRAASGKASEDGEKSGKVKTASELPFFVGKLKISTVNSTLI